MANYISSNANRFYAAIESAYGQAAVVTAANRFPAVRMQAQQLLQSSKRLDKTGTRTFKGTPATSRRQTAFETGTYLTSWNGTGQPSYGPLFQAALGAAPVLNSGLVVAAVTNGTQVQTTAAHGLTPGSAISYAGEIRFVIQVVDSLTIIINAPFTTTPAGNVALGPAITYPLAIALPSITLYDYWDPITAVSRVITGGVVDTLTLSVTGDFHEFTFSGPACDLLDSTSFVSGSAGLANFPSEPALGSFDYSIVPGHLGEVWLGGTPNQFFTLTQASLEVKNNVDVRNQEFGSSYPRGFAAATREVATNFTVFAQDDAQTEALYAAAKARTTISAMLQLGRQQGQLLAAYLKAVTPEIPNYDGSETRLQWTFKNNLAQGTAEDEIYVAFA